MSIAPTHPPSNAKIGLLGYFWTLSKMISKKYDFDLSIIDPSIKHKKKNHINSTPFPESLRLSTADSSSCLVLLQTTKMVSTVVRMTPPKASPRVRPKPGPFPHPAYPHQSYISPRLMIP